MISQPQAVVPAGHWQAAETRGAWTLVGCTVAPAFDFAGFELAPPAGRQKSDQRRIKSSAAITAPRVPKGMIGIGMK